MITVAVALGLALVGFAALLAGPTAFFVLVILLAAVLLVDLALLLGGAGATPVLPVALIPGVVLPILVATGGDGVPGAGWEQIPDLFAIAFLLGFALILAFGRRSGAVMGLAATAMASLIVGLGASSVVALRGLPNGFVWVSALLLLVVAADAAAPLVAALGRRLQDRRRDAGGFPGSHEPPRSPVQGVVPAIVAVAVVSAALALFFGPPLEPLVLALLSLVAVVAALGGGYLQRALSAEAGVHPDTPAARIGEGLVLGALDAVVIAAPAAYVLARSVSL